MKKKKSHLINLLNRTLTTKQLLLFCCFILLFGGFCYKFYFDKFIASTTIASFPPFNTPTPTIYMTPTLDPTLRPDQHTTYTSSKLGISFSYINQAAGRQNFYTREIGDTIYLYYNPFNKEFLGTDEEFLKEVSLHGKKVTVLTKDVQTSLVDAIKQHVFGGKIPQQCYITTDTHYGSPRDDNSFERAVIWEYPSKTQLTYQQMREYILSCTSYAGNNVGVSYFMMDPKHPSKFLFIQLGQDNISSGIGGTWDTTIKIF